MSSIEATRGPVLTAVVVNTNRVDDWPQRCRVVQEALAAAGWPPALVLETSAEDPGAGQVRAAIEAGAAVVFACGGDGTVRSCIEALVDTDVALAVLPAGTGNLLAANLGLPDHPAAGVDLVLAGGRRRIDTGEVDGRAFAVMAGVGFDARLLEATSERAKAVVGPLAYVATALAHLRERPFRAEVTIDQQPPMAVRARCVLVGNVGRLQGGVRLLPDAAPDDARLDVAIISPRTVVQWAGLAIGVLRRHRRVPRLTVHRASTVGVTITGPQPQPRQLDGDVIDAGRTLVARVRPASLLLCVAQPEESADLAEHAAPGERADRDAPLPG